MGIKRPKKNLKIKEKELDSLNGIEYPVFCFKYLQPCSIKDCHEPKFFFHFLERLQKLSNIGWKEIRISYRHGFGTEKIPIEKIKPQLPTFVTPEIKHLIVFRADGDNRPFLGLINKNKKLFHIIFIESQFGDIYDHN